MTLPLTAAQARCLYSLRERGPYGWCHGVRLAGGARARMIARMVAAELCTDAPHRLTLLGRLSLTYYEHHHRASR